MQNDPLPNFSFSDIVVKQLNIWQELTLGRRIDLSTKSINQVLPLLPGIGPTTSNKIKLFLEKNKLLNCNKFQLISGIGPYTTNNICRFFVH